MLAVGICMKIYEMNKNSKKYLIEISHLQALWEIKANDGPVKRPKLFESSQFRRSQVIEM